MNCLNKKLFFILLILFCINSNLQALSEENTISYSFKINKDMMSAIAGDRFGDQSDDFAREIINNNINISKFKIVHEGITISFIINFNSYIIEKGDKYTLDKAIQIPIVEQISFDKYFMYRIVAKDYHPTSDDLSKILTKGERKIILDKLDNDYLIAIKMKFNINLTAVLKNDTETPWIVEKSWNNNTEESNTNSYSTTNVVETKEITATDNEDVYASKARQYIDAQKKKNDTDKRSKEETEQNREKELKEKTQQTKDLKKKEAAIKEMIERKKREVEENRYDEEKKKKELEEKQKKDSELEIIHKVKLLAEAKRIEEDKKQKLKKQREEEKLQIEKKAQERARIIMEAFEKKSVKLKLEEEVKKLEEQASVEYEKIKADDDERKQIELKLREEERMKEELRIKRAKNEEENKKIEDKLKKEEELQRKTEENRKKEEEKKILLQAKVPDAIVSREILSQKVFREPEIDGKPENAIWKQAKAFALVTKKKNEEKTLIIKSIHTNTYIYFYLQWEDNTENVTHKTWIWDKEKSVYKESKDLEDKIDMMFNLKNKFSACMLSGQDYEADLWEWGAAKTNYNGSMDDQKLTISTKKIKRANSYKANNGNKVYIKYEFDLGDPSYKQDIVVDYKWDKVPRFTFQNPSGSRGDIKAKGLWKDGVWSLEIKRRLITDDKAFDTQFDPRKENHFAVAIFDQQEFENHFTSEELFLKFVE